jgi:hypothetical protein
MPPQKVLCGGDANYLTHFYTSWLLIVLNVAVP